MIALLCISWNKNNCKIADSKMKCRGKRVITWYISPSVKFSQLHFYVILYRGKSITFWTVYSAKIECMRTEARHFLLDAGIQIIFSSGFGNCFELNWLFLFSVLQDNLGVCDGPGQPRLSGKPAGYLYPVQVSRLGYKHRSHTPDTHSEKWFNPQQIM